MATTSDILLHGSRLGKDVAGEAAAHAQTTADDAKISAELALNEADQLGQQVNGKEPTIALGTTGDYYRGDKTWQNLASGVRDTVLTGLSLASSAAVSATDSIIAAFGKVQAQLGLKANTADVNTALANKADKATTLAGYGITDAYTMAQTDSRIQAVVGAAPAALDTLQEIAAQLQSDESAVGALTTTVAGKEPAITAGTTAQYWRGDKTWRSFATDVLATVLTGFSTATGTAVVSTDSIVVAVGKLQAQITAALAYVDSAIVTERSAIANLLNKTLVGVIIKDYIEQMQTQTVTGSVTLDLTNGTLQKLILNGNTTINLPAPVAGRSYSVLVYYNGAFVPTFAGTGLKWSNQVAPPAKSTAGFYDLFVFTSDGSSTLGRSGGGNF